MLLDARIPLTIVTSAEAGSRGPDRRPASPIEPDRWTVLVVCVAVPASLSLPVEGWAAVRVLPPVLQAPILQASSADATATGHATGCACCVARSPLAMLLSELFQQRARGKLPLFRRVLLVVSPSAVGAASRMATDDRLVSALFRWERVQGTN